MDLYINNHAHFKERFEYVVSSIAKTHPSLQKMSMLYLCSSSFVESDVPKVSYDTWKQFQGLESFHIGGQPLCPIEWLPVVKAFEHTLKDLRIESLDSFKNKHFHLLFSTPGLRLRELSLAHCRFLDGPGMFNSVALNHSVFKLCLQSLEILDLDGITDITDVYLCEFFSVSPHLRSLVIDGANITDSTPENITVLLPTLRRLRISFCETITDKALACFANLKHLGSLSLKKNADFTSEGFVQFATRRPTCLPCGELVGVMKHLSIIDCPGFDDAALKSVAESFPDLTYLDISWCYHITNLGISSLSIHCRKIEVLNIVGLYASLDNLLDDPMPTLRVLDLEQSHVVDDSRLNQLKAAKPWIDITDYYGQKVNCEDVDV